MAFKIKARTQPAEPAHEIVQQLNKEPLVGGHMINVTLKAPFSTEQTFPHGLGRAYTFAWPGAYSSSIDVLPPSEASDPANSVSLVWHGFEAITIALYVV